MAAGRKRQRQVLRSRVSVNGLAHVLGRLPAPCARRHALTTRARPFVCLCVRASVCRVLVCGSLFVILLVLVLVFRVRVSLFGIVFVVRVLRVLRVCVCLFVDLLRWIVCFVFRCSWAGTCRRDHSITGGTKSSGGAVLASIIASTRPPSTWLPPLGKYSRSTPSTPGAAPVPQQQC